MAHLQTKQFIHEHLDLFANAIIGAVSDQMWLTESVSVRNCKRNDHVLFIEEQTIRYRGDGKTGQDNRPKRFVNDGVFYIVPGTWGMNRIPSELSAFTVGIEIKTDINDLYADAKIEYYLGWTDFYFIVVPIQLRDSALKKIHEMNDARIGLIVYARNPSVKCNVVPVRQSILAENKYALALQALFSDSNKRFVDIYIDPCDFGAYIEPGAYLRRPTNVNSEFDGSTDVYINTKLKEK